MTDLNDIILPLKTNDSVHRVAAGGRLKHRKPTGRHSGATPC